MAKGMGLATGLPERLRDRYLDLLGSIYVYNEHRGYTALDRVLRAIRTRWPEDHALIGLVEKHRADEHKHYVMFRRWFERRGVMPLEIDCACGHIDRFVQIMFRSTIDELDPAGIVGQEELFERLCRVISLTEKRGHRQVETLLRNPLVKRERTLARIFRVIEQDEPSHWAPYDGWLQAHGKRQANGWERAIDGFIHGELLCLKLPLLFLSPRLRRRTAWPDARDGVDSQAASASLALRAEGVKTAAGPAISPIAGAVERSFPSTGPAGISTPEVGTRTVTGTGTRFLRDLPRVQ